MVELSGDFEKFRKCLIAFFLKLWINLQYLLNFRVVIMTRLSNLKEVVVSIIKFILAFFIN